MAQKQRFTVVEITCWLLEPSDQLSAENDKSIDDEFVPTDDETFSEQEENEPEMQSDSEVIGIGNTEDREVIKHELFRVK